jgi:exonuclease SbcD
MAIKILHTADWHLGKKLDHFSRFEEQIEVMDEICSIADEQNVDMVIVAGDLFDTFNPSAEAQDLFYKTLHRLSKGGKRIVFTIAGNHDMPERIEAPHPLAELNGIILCGFPNTEINSFKTDFGIEVLQSEPGFVSLRHPNVSFPIRLLYTPYANEIRLKTFLGIDDRENSLRNLLEQKWKSLADKYCDEKGVNLMTAHLYFMKKDGEQEIEPEGERSILHIGGAQAIYSENIPPQMQYVALGHLHRYHRVDNAPCPIVYSSSPIAYSFSEAKQNKQVVIIELEPGKEAIYKPVELKKGFGLERGEFSSIDEAIIWLKAKQNKYVEITIQTNTYLDAQLRKILANEHSKIVNIIPKLIFDNTSEDESKNKILSVDETQDLESLFIEYFKYANSDKIPSESLLALFKEVINQNND